MFYSQFILAKKGPLGTIWIAAHLERKLRKNQVADTDIGVSVDSIIFPEVPIALRLSSHLLLGVVRVYSRKVNYLFDDCSEALLKIKQAFRSTAVDLPPEESTAPYHSITLPETFDLDDFELPENEMFQGNYVDHHVSAREQITLQDTMEGVVYSTSQFGPDERFGDGGTCEINIDLDEEDFLQKVEETIPGESHDTYASPHPITPKEEVEDDISDKQVEFINANFEPPEYAEAPATPGLVEEANLSSVKKTLNYDEHLSESVPENDISVDNQANVNSAANLDPAFAFCEESSNTAHRSSKLENGASVEKRDLRTSNLHIDNVGQEDNSGKQDVSHSGFEKDVLAANCTHPVFYDNERAETLLTENMEVGIVPTGKLKNVQTILISEAPPIETLRSAVGEAAGEADNLLEDFTPDKEFLEDRSSNVKISNISGKKRSLTESIMTEASSEINFSNRTLESVPDDDDLLSSILVGKRSAVLKLKPSPAPSELNFSKRQRINQRVAAHKRKVLIDDSMVLHGDAIRQQLTNTEDLRRARKKAPCTLPEISSIQRQFLGDEIYNETVLTGFSVELHYIHKEAYDLSHVRVVEPAQTIVPTIGVNSIDKPIVDYEAEIGASVDTRLIGDGLIPKITEIGSCSKPKQVEDLGLIPEELKSQQEQVDNATEMDLATENVGRVVQDDSAVSGAETQSVLAILHEDAESADKICVGKFHSETEDVGACACTSSVHYKPMTLNPLCSENDSSKGGFMMEKGFDGAEENAFRVDPGGDAREMREASVEGNTSPNYEGTNAERTCGFPTNDFLGDNHNCSIYGNVDADNIENANVNHQDQLEQNVQELLDNQSPIEFHHDFGHSLFQNGNISHGFGYQESTSCFEPRGSRDGEIPGVENAAVDLYDDFEDATAIHDTDFLNMDDEDDAVADDETVDVDDPHLLENRGWSVRTRFLANYIDRHFARYCGFCHHLLRGVAKYLQFLFHKERLAEIHGKKVVVMDNLLAGKNCKEASRLFFESLVLKTRDYINVEQQRPYDNIIVTPRTILMKSEF